MHATSFSVTPSIVHVEAMEEATAAKTKARQQPSASEASDRSCSASTYGAPFPSLGDDNFYHQTNHRSWQHQPIYFTNHMQHLRSSKCFGFISQQY
jgi:hypothetical protein